MSIDTAAKRRQATCILPIHKAPLPGVTGRIWRLWAAWTYYPHEATPGVVVGGERVRIKKGTLSIEKRIEERSTASFTVIDLTGTASFSQGQPVMIYEFDAELIFGGVVETPDDVIMAPKGGLYHPITCKDWHYLADKRLVAESYLDTSAGDIVKDIRTKYLDAEVVTIGNIEDGPDIVEAVFNYVRASDAFDALAEKAAKIWFIDEYKKLYFQDRDITAAPWALDDTTNRPAKMSALLSGGNPMYRNRQYIRGGRGTTTEQTEVFIGDGEQVAFTVGFPFQKVPTSVTVQDLGARTIGIKGIDEAKDCYWNKGDATLTFAAAPLAGKTITVVYYGQFPILTLTEDPLEIAARLAIEGTGTGYVDDIADEPTLNSTDASFDSGLAKLAKFGVVGKQLMFRTTRSGLNPGQLLTVTLSGLNLLAEQMLIESVTIGSITGNYFYDIVAIQGPTLGSWTNLFKALAKMKGEVIERLNVGTDQLLIILAATSENWGWGESFVIRASEILRPNAAGDDFNLYAYPSTPNWQCVDDIVPDDDDTYVYASLADWRTDYYNVQNSSVVEGTINFIKVYARCKKTAAPSAEAKIIIKSGGVVSEGGVISPTTDWVDYSHQWDTPPEGGTWDRDKINALQIGISLRRVETLVSPCCTQVYVEVL